MRFVDIGYDEYVIADDVLYALENYNYGASAKLKSKAIREEKLYKLGLRTTGNTLLVMKDGTAYEIAIPLESLVRRFENNGTPFVFVGQGYYVSFDNIDVFSTLNSVFAVRLKTKLKNTSRDDYNFIRQGQEQKTILRTVTGDVVKSSLSIAELKNEIAFAETRKGDFNNRS